MIGRTLSHYKVLEKIGEGGMGEVFLAKDTKLDREVAVKVLPAAFSENKERLARFEREARLLASLNHPNIAAIYELEESDGVHFLALEYVPGETLAERIKQGPIPVDEALPLFKQIAEGLEAAHEKGVIHRDLKPANIKVTPEGKVKVLDFGLAKALQEETPLVDSSQSPTLTKGTALGTIMGTAAYMSPEQARGKAVDKRTDIWAFGCCLYEALTGKTAFLGDTVTDTIAKIVEREPDWEALPATTPTLLRRLLRRCLTKDPTHRLQHIGDARIEIEEAQSESLTSAPSVVAQPSLWKWVIPWGLTVVAAAIVTWALLRTTSSRSPGVSRLTISAPPGQTFQTGARGPALAVSPDGKQLAYVAGGGTKRQLYLRNMDEFEARPIPRTEGAQSPFFSPDGQWVGFKADGKLKKVMMGGAVSISICDIESGPVGPWKGGSWGPDDWIYFSAASGSLSRVPADGGELEAVTELDLDKGEWLHELPDVLPNGDAVLFTLIDGDIVETGSFGSGKIAVLSLRTGEQRVLVENAIMPRYAAGYLVYLAAGALVAAPFDLDRLKVTGNPVTMVENVMWNPGLGWANFAISREGALAYMPGGAIAEEPNSLVWVDRKGETVPVTAERHAFGGVRVSPDGQRLALAIRREGNQDLWVYEIARDTLRRLTITPQDESSQTWHSDGTRLSYAQVDPPTRNIFWIAADGSGEPEKLFDAEYDQRPNSWSPDGRLVVFTQHHPDTGLDIGVLPIEGDRTPRALIKTPFDEWNGIISPDGRWIAYESNETGRYEVYVTTFPVVGAKRRVSTNGGHSPVWAPNGRELFYRSEAKVMAVAVETEPDLIVGRPLILFQANFARDLGCYDITPDGQRFVIIQGEEHPPAEIRAILNWSKELKRLVPTN